MDQKRLMRDIRRNLAAVRESQRRSKARGAGIDRRTKEIASEQARVRRSIDRLLNSPVDAARARKKR